MLFGNCMIYMLLRLLPSAPLEAADDNKVRANQWGDSNIQRISSPNQQKCLIRWKTATKHCRGPRAPSSAFVAAWHLNKMHQLLLIFMDQRDKLTKQRLDGKGHKFSFEELLKFWGIIATCFDANPTRESFRVLEIPECWCQVKVGNFKV